MYYVYYVYYIIYIWVNKEARKRYRATYTGAYHHHSGWFYFHPVENKQLVPTIVFYHKKLLPTSYFDTKKIFICATD